MDKEETIASCAFDTLFTRNAPHILEAIFLSLDYESFHSCLMVNKTWNQLLTSESFKKRGKQVFQNWLLYAAVNGKRDVVHALLRMGAEPDKVAEDRGGLDGGTALHLAASAGQKDVVEALLDGGADIQKRDIDTMTPLLLSAMCGHMDVAKLLLDRGADPNTGTKDGFTPLHYAAYNGHEDMTELLLDRGADPLKRDASGLTPSDYRIGILR